MKLPKKGETWQVAKNATPEQVAQIMRDVIRATSNDPQVRTISRQLLTDATNYRDYLQRLANYAYHHVYFFPDPVTDQIIRTPTATLREGIGNCVDYTVLIGALAYAAGLHVVIRIAQLSGQTNYGHVYPVINDVIIDVVPGQDQTGNEINTRPAGKLPVIGKTLVALKTQDFTV